MASNTTSGAVLFAKNIATVAQFYEGVLGARVLHSEPGHIVLAIGPTELVVHALPPQIAQDIVLETPLALREDTPIKLFFPVDRLAVARAQAASLGGGLAPPEKEWAARGFRACDGWDPEGNVVQLREPVG